MGNIDINWQCVKEVTEKSLGLAQQYDQQYVDLMIASGNDLMAFLEILGEIGGVVANLNFVLSKIPSAPGASAPPLSSVIPIDTLAAAPIAAAAAAASAAASAGAAPPSIPEAMSSARSVACSTACMTGGFGGGQLANQINALNASVMKMVSTAAAASASSAAASAAASFSVPTPPITIIGSPPPPPIDPNTVRNPMLNLMEVLLATLRALESDSIQINLNINSVLGTMFQIKDLVRDVFALFNTIRAFLEIAKKNALTIIKFMIQLERALKALALAATIFPFTIVPAAQMASWFGVVGEAMALIAGLLDRAMDHLLESENNNSEADDNKAQFEAQLDVMMDCISGYKSCMSGLENLDIHGDLYFFSGGGGNG